MVEQYKREKHTLGHFGAVAFTGFGLGIITMIGVGADDYFTLRKQVYNQPNSCAIIEVVDNSGRPVPYTLTQEDGRTILRLDIVDLSSEVERVNNELEAKQREIETREAERLNLMWEASSQGSVSTQNPYKTTGRFVIRAPGF